MKLFVNGTTQHVGNRPTPVQAPNDSSGAYACGLSPSCHGHGLSPQRKDVVVSFVSRLFFCDYPLAVVGRVAFFIVDAVKRVLRGGAWPHVFQKCSEGIFPLRAHRNAAASVAVVGRILGIVAALNHTRPGPPLRALTHPVCGSTKSSHFFVEAAAASRVSATQIRPSNSHGVSAYATAQPSETFGFLSYWLQHREPSELLVGEIAKRRHAAILPQEARP